MTSLGNAIATENRNKPKNSNLVLANDSETIIPAAGGLNNTLSDVVAALQRGFGYLGGLFTRNQQMTVAAIKQSTQASMQGDRQILSAIKAASAAGGLGGSLGGSPGSLSAARALASSMGLQMTSYQRSGPANASYHNVGRAMDFAGNPASMKKFALAMSSRYGSKMAELIYTPLGYGIKHGKKVAPYAAAQHYDHVHVAFGRGPGHPTLFSSANAAHAYERMMAPAGARIASVTANSSEFGGGAPVTINQNITVEGAMDPRATAEAVWSYTAKKVQELQNNSFA
jgi:hypothetical protein